MRLGYWSDEARLAAEVRRAAKTGMESMWILGLSTDLAGALRMIHGPRFYTSHCDRVDSVSRFPLCRCRS